MARFLNRLTQSFKSALVQRCLANLWMLMSVTTQSPITQVKECTVMQHVSEALTTGGLTKEHLHDMQNLFARQILCMIQLVKAVCAIESGQY